MYALYYNLSLTFSPTYFIAIANVAMSVTVVEMCVIFTFIIYLLHLLRGVILR